MKGLVKQAIITAGAQGCRRYEDIAADLAFDGHLVGRCRYCPRMIDYTVAQATPVEIRGMYRKKSRRGQANARASVEARQRQKEEFLVISSY